MDMAVDTAVERDMAVDMAALQVEAPRFTPKDTDLVDLDTVVEIVDTAVETEDTAVETLDTAVDTVNTAVETVDTVVDILTSTALMLAMEALVDLDMGEDMVDLDMGADMVDLDMALDMDTNALKCLYHSLTPTSSIERYLAICCWNVTCMCFALRVFVSDFQYTMKLY